MVSPMVEIMDGDTKSLLMVMFLIPSSNDQSWRQDGNRFKTGIRMIMMF